MRIHHLNCGSLCPRGGRLFGGSGPIWSPARMCCHCLLIEGEDGLVLIDSGLGVDDIADPSRLGALFRIAARPRLDMAETAFRQIADLGFRVSDLRHIVPTHLDLDHAGGLADFPAASVHVFAAELQAAMSPSFRERFRYRGSQLSGRRQMGARRRGGRGLVRLRQRASAAGNARRRPAHSAAGALARPLRRRSRNRPRLAPPLRRRLFSSRGGRGGPGAGGAFLVRIARRLRQQGAARQSDAA